MRDRLGMLTSVLAMLAWPAHVGAGGDQLTARSANHVVVVREIGVYAGVLLTPGEIGRDVSRAGGDVLIASLGDTLLTGGRIEARTHVVGGAIDVSAAGRRIGVRNEAGVDFPNHGQSPVLYSLDGRLYPFARSLRGGRIMPYVGAGAGGALVTVDLDNVSGQELRHLWARTIMTGVKLPLTGDSTFVDIQIRRTRLTGRGPLHSFDTTALVVGVTRK